MDVNRRQFFCAVVAAFTVFVYVVFLRYNAWGQNKESEIIQTADDTHKQELRNNEYLSGGTHKQELLNDEYLSGGTHKQKLLNNEYLSGGTHKQKLLNNEYLSGGTHKQKLLNNEYLSGGTHKQKLLNDEYLSGGTHKQEFLNNEYLSGGTHKQKLLNNEYLSGGTHKQKLLNNEYLSGGTHNIERSSFGGWNILYDEDALRAEVLNIHKSYYVPRGAEECVRRPPDCMIAGVDKSGTVELLTFMAVHPYIVTKRREYLFHNKRGLRANTINDMPCAYRDQISMAKADGDYLDPKRPGALLKLNPNMKIIFLVREPVSRAIASLTFQPTHGHKRRGITDSKSLKTSIRSMLKRHSRPLVMSTYDTHFVRFLKAFKRESILIMEDIEFKHNPSAVFKQVEKFLGIKSFESENHFVTNPESGFSCIRTLDFTSKNMVCYERNRGRKHSMEIDEDDKNKLNKYFKPHNEKLFRMIGQRYNW